jgi:hypothetical protein
MGFLVSLFINRVIKAFSMAFMPERFSVVSQISFSRGLEACELSESQFLQSFWPKYVGFVMSPLLLRRDLPIESVNHVLKKRHLASEWFSIRTLGFSREMSARPSGVL